MLPLPRLLASSVIRSSHQGDSHGGLYLIDLETDRITQVLDWNDPTINWEGRGADRGLRGIAFHDDKVYLAASDEIFVYNSSFDLIESFSNRYLKHCHEIFISEDVLYLTSTGYDSILEYDLLTKSFKRGLCLRGKLPVKRPRRLTTSYLPRPLRPLKWLDLVTVPELNPFDPNSDSGPLPGDTFHINSVFVRDASIYICGTRLGRIFQIKGSCLVSYAVVPSGTHNARPYRDGVLLNHTSAEKIIYMNLHGKEIESFPVMRYNEDDLLMSHVPNDHARQAFARGLCVSNEDLLIAGSSPATITLYRHGCPAPLKSINITMDIRNAVHGLEIWPY